MCLADRGLIDGHSQPRLLRDGKIAIDRGQDFRISDEMEQIMADEKDE